MQSCVDQTCLNSALVKNKGGGGGEGVVCGCGSGNSLFILALMKSTALDY